MISQISLDGFKIKKVLKPRCIIGQKSQTLLKYDLQQGKIERGRDREKREKERIREIGRKEKKGE